MIRKNLQDLMQASIRFFSSPTANSIKTVAVDTVKKHPVLAGTIGAGLAYRFMYSPNRVLERELTGLRRDIHSLDETIKENIRRSTPK